MATVAFIVVVEKATGVRNADGMTGTSDPYAKISTPTAPAVLNERTEVVQNNLNPLWDCCLLVALPASVPAILKLEVFDSDSGTFVDGTDVSSHLQRLGSSRRLSHANFFSWHLLLHQPNLDNTTHVGIGFLGQCLL
jgi:hypothetical protein